MTLTGLLKREVEKYRDRKLPDLTPSNQTWEEIMEEILRPPHTIPEKLRYARRWVGWQIDKIVMIKYDAEHLIGRMKDNYSWRDKAAFHYTFAKSMVKVVQEAKNLHDPDHPDCRYAPMNMPEEYLFNPNKFTDEEYAAAERIAWEEMEYKFDVMLKGFNGYVIYCDYEPTLPLDYPAWKAMADESEKNMKAAIEMLGEMYVYLAQ